MNTSTHRNKKSKPKMFLLFLLLALIFWVLIKFSKDTTAGISANLDYINLPTTISLSPDNLKEVSFEAVNNNFQTLLYKLRKPTIKIDVSKYYKQGDTIIRLSREDVGKIISSQLSSIAKDQNIFVDQLHINLDIMQSKKIPVKLISRITYQNGYKPLGEVILKPDSITISGLSKSIDTINYIETKELTKKDVSTPIHQSLTINFNQEKDITLSQKAVEVTINVEEFTQKQVLVPIEVINTPEIVNLKTFPEQITVSFDVSINNYNSITQKDFKIQCDYAKRMGEEKFMVPTLVLYPEDLYNIELSDKKVEFLIFK